MKIKYIIATYLRSLLRINRPDINIAIYTTQEFFNVASQNPISLINLDLPIDVDLEAEISFLKDIEETLERLKNVFLNNLSNINSSFQALQIKSYYYFIYELPKISSELIVPNPIVKNKVVLITGGAQGFGRGIAEALARAGALVFIADINLEQARQTAQELNDSYKAELIKVIQMNCADEASVKMSVESVIQELGGLDILINNAGIIKSGDLENMDLENFNKMIQINYVGYFLVVKYFSPIFKYQYLANKLMYSDIIQINSKSGLAGSNKNSAYAGSKFGGLGLTQSFALELIDYNIKVNAICPGNFYEGPLWSDPEKGLFKQYLDSGKIPNAKNISDVKNAYLERTPIKRGCSIEDVVKCILYVVDQKYETGQALPITGGQIMLR